MRSASTSVMSRTGLSLLTCRFSGRLGQPSSAGTGPTYAAGRIEALVLSDGLDMGQGARSVARGGGMDMLSIVIPAHNETQVIGRLLRQLVSTAEEGELDILVVANGCSDNTAKVAAAFGPPVQVLSIPVASKREALATGNLAAKGFPRLYVDADVELRTEDVRELGQALLRPGVLAASPERTLALAGRRWPIRWYYDVWARLPEVQQGLFGRGVIGVSEAGYARIAV